MSKAEHPKDFVVPVVAVTDRNGAVAHVSTATELNNLVYGSGYSVRDFDSVHEAAEFLASGGAVSAPEKVDKPPAQ